VQIHPQGWVRMNSRSLGDAEGVDAPLVLVVVTPVGAATYDQLIRMAASRRFLVPLEEELVVEHDQGVLHLRA